MSVAVAHRSSDVCGLDDDDLVRLARAGDEAAFDQIVLRYQGPLASYCRRWLDPHRAEEVVQHTLMKAFVCLRDDDRPLALRPWLYRVAHNAALNALDKKGSDWEQLDENYDGVPQPPQLAEQRERLQGVVDEIQALPARQRDALLLNEFEGRAYADIAVALGTSESGVRGLLRRARSQLRRAAAAALIPFPALRELARSDAGRSLQADRASEIIGSAGAAGGLGVAGGGIGLAGGAGVAGGGLTKLAAGVLAAGTLAGGGTALERSHHSSGPGGAKDVAPATADPLTAPSGSPAVGTDVGAGPQRSAARRRGLSGRGRLLIRQPDKPARGERQTTLNGTGGRRAPKEQEPAEAPPVLVPLGTALPGLPPPPSAGGEGGTQGETTSPRQPSGGSGSGGSGSGSGSAGSGSGSSTSDGGTARPHPSGSGESTAPSGATL